MISPQTAFKSSQTLTGLVSPVSLITITVVTIIVDLLSLLSVLLFSLPLFIVSDIKA